VHKADKVHCIIVSYEEIYTIFTNILIVPISRIPFTKQMVTYKHSLDAIYLQKECRARVCMFYLFTMC